MLKSIQIKIVLIFMILGMLMIGTLGVLFGYELQNINNAALEGENVSELVISQIEQTKIITLIAIGVFALISVVVGLVFLKVIIKPILRLIKNAELVASGEQSEIKCLDDGKTKNEIDELTKAFSLMHSELNENLKEVSRQKRQIETILLHVTDGIIAFNLNGDIIHCNRAARQFLELSEEDDSFEKIFKKLDVDINLEKIIYLENWTSTEQRITLGDRSLNLFFAPFKDENERPGGVIIVIQDITEHVKLDMMRTEFVADVSHELKTPITSILGYSDTLLEGECDENISRKFLERISTQAKRMAVLVSDLLTLSRYDSDMVNAKKTEFDLGELVKNTYDNLLFEIEKKNQKAECFVTANVPYVFADKSGIERVVTNILTNAIKYTPEGGEIKIYVGFVYNDAYIKIIDTGIGIPEDDLEKIFERFYRVDKARTREMGGTGLGLSIAKEIIEKNDSRIDIKSELGKGTEVVIRIPTKRLEKDK